jgi:hypothetical protein
MFMPSLHTNYTVVSNFGSGTTNADTSVLGMGQTYNQWSQNANLRLSYQLTDKVRFATNVGAGYNMLGNNPLLSNTGSLVSTGYTNSRALYTAGVGIESTPVKNVSSTVRYDKQNDLQGYQSQIISVRATVTF